MKYLALVAACLLALLLGSPARADDAAGPAGELTLHLAQGVPLGASSVVPLRGTTPALADGDELELSWTVTDAAVGSAITAGSSTYVVGEALPALDLPDTTTADQVVLTLRATTSSEYGDLEGDASQVYDLDFVAPQASLGLSSNALFPAHDRYLDWVTITPGSSSTDVGDYRIVLIAPDGTEDTIYHRGSPIFDTVRFRGGARNARLAPGAYTVRALITDRAGNTSHADRPLRIDDRHVARQTYTRTIPAVRTLADRFVGACSHLGAAKGRGWKGSLGLYSTPCAKKSGSIVVTVNGAWIPPSIRGYPSDVTVSMYGGAARGTTSAYVVHGWLRAKDNVFIGRKQFTGKLGPHVASVGSKSVIREIDGDHWVYWQLGLSEGSHYDVKSFTVRTAYYALVPPRSRTASEAKTIAEPSGAPGPGYTVPKTDAAELPAAYSPGM